MAGQGKEKVLTTEPSSKTGPCALDSGQWIHAKTCKYRLSVTCDINNSSVKKQQIL